MTALAGVHARRIVRAIADAADRWSNADFPPRVRLLDAIVARTGYSLPVVEYALDQIFFSLTVPSIAAVIDGELGSIDALDGFVDRTDRPRAMAAPAGRVCVISSRTTIGVAIVPAVFALCAKCDVLVKDREDGLVRAFFASLAEELDEMAVAARAETWSSEDESTNLAEFDAVVAFGRDLTITRIRERCAAHARFVGFGSKASIGYITRDALADTAHARSIAEGAARDLVLYETEGCLSLHALFVERGGAVAPHEFSLMLAAAAERASVEFPPGMRDARAAARIMSARNLAAFRSAGGTGAVFSDANTSFLAVLDPPAQEPPQFLPRTLGIHSVDGPAEVADYLQRHNVPVEAVALDTSRADACNMAVEIGATRITRFGELQRPPVGENHGGRSRINDYVRWVTSET